MSETIGELVDKLIKTEIRISEGYREGNVALRDELIKELDRRKDEQDELKEKIEELEKEIEYFKDDIEEQVKDLDRRIEKIED